MGYGTFFLLRRGLRRPISPQINTFTPKALQGGNDEYSLYLNGGTVKARYGDSERGRWGYMTGWEIVSGLRRRPQGRDGQEE